MILLLTALSREASAVAGSPLVSGETVELGRAVRVRASGMGADRAAAAAERLLDEVAPIAAGGGGTAGKGAVTLVSVGVAGALSPALRSGDVVVADGVRESHGTATQGAGNRRPTPPTAPETTATTPPAPPPGAPLPCTELTSQRLARLLEAGGLRVQRGAVLSAEDVLATPEQKGAWQDIAIAVDTESAAIARVARARGAAFLSVRVIIDELEMHIPAAALASTRPDGSTSPLVLARCLARHPGQIPSLLALGRAWSRAKASLARTRPAFLRLADEDARADNRGDEY